MESSSSHSNTATFRPLTVENNPYRAKRPWPPDFSKLDPKHQFRLERKYKRRLRQATFRPGWVKGVKLAQYGICGGVATYAVLFMDWNTYDKPFEGVRNWFRNAWAAGTTTPARPNLGRIQADATSGNKSDS